MAGHLARFYATGDLALSKAVEMMRIIPARHLKLAEGLFTKAKTWTYHKHAAVCTQNFLDYLFGHRLYVLYGH